MGLSPPRATNRLDQNRLDDDRDHDGKIEEWRRGRDTYYDTDGDGQNDQMWIGFDYMSHGWVIREDTNRDGFFDTETQDRGDGAMYFVRNLRAPVPRFPRTR